jgi:hypothetical protein
MGLALMLALDPLFGVEGVGLSACAVVDGKAGKVAEVRPFQPFATVFVEFLPPGAGEIRLRSGECADGERGCDDEAKPPDPRIHQIDSIRQFADPQAPKVRVGEF